MARRYARDSRGRFAGGTGGGTIPATKVGRARQKSTRAKAKLATATSAEAASKARLAELKDKLKASKARVKTLNTIRTTFTRR